MITPTAAAAEALRGLSKINLDDDPGAALSREMGHAGTPLFVKRTDLSDRDYYLVPWEVNDQVQIVVQVDAATGALSSMAVLRPPVAKLLVTPSQSIDAVERTLNVAATGTPDLIWEPSRESGSPLQPLYRVPVATGYVFVSSDGKVYRSLTPFGRGG